MAAAAAIALLLSGCGSSDDDKGKDGKDASQGDHAKKTDGPTPSADESAGGKGSLPGVWTTKASGEKLTLTVVGEKASLLRGDKVCTGQVMTTGGDSALVLKCPGGTGEDRSTGKVAELAAKTLKVTWNGGETDTYTKVAQSPAKLPKNRGELKDVPGLSDKLREATVEPGKVREYPGN